MSVLRNAHTAPNNLTRLVSHPMLHQHAAIIQGLSRCPHADSLQLWGSVVVLLFNGCLGNGEHFKYAEHHYP
jgi:hypothetical protein